MQHSFKLTLIAAMLTGSVSAYADETVNAGSKAEATSLETVQVTARNRNTRTENRNSYTTSAMRTTTGLSLSPKETPQSVSVITKRQMSDQGITSMEDALKTTTGINVIRDTGTARFQSRGFYIDQIEEDGISSTVPGAVANPMYDAQSATDLAVYDHIEVVRGATGLTQANGEPGGTVNAVRKRPTSQTQIQGDLMFNRFGTARATIDASGSLNEAKTLHGRVVGVASRDGSFKDSSAGNTFTLYGVMDAQLDDNTKLTWGGLYQRKISTPDDWGIPMGVNGSDSGLPRDTFLSYDWSRNRARKINLFAEVEHHFSDDWKLTGTLNYNNNHSLKRNGGIYSGATSYAGWTTGGVLPSGWLGRYDRNEKQFTIKTNLNGKYRLLGQEHDVFFGYTYNHKSSGGERRQFRHLRSYDPSSFRGNEVAEPNWYAGTPWMLWDYDNTERSHSLMAGTRFNPTEKLHILAGTRYTNMTTKSVVDYHYTSGAVDNDPDSVTRRKHHRFIPYFGITYDITPHHSIYASYTSIFKPNGYKDRHERYLPPVLGNNYEIGWKGEWYQGKLNASVALFNIVQKNRSVQVYDNIMSRWYYEPVGRVRSRGVDMEISGKLTDDWQLFAGYTLNNSKYLDAENRGAIPAGTNFSKHTPRHMFRLYTSYRLPGAANKWTIGGGVTAQSETSSLADVKQGGYALFNANVQYSFNDNMKLSLIGSNLTDRRVYENQKTRQNGINNYLIEPRNFVLKFDWKL